MIILTHLQTEPGQLYKSQDSKGDKEMKKNNKGFTLVELIVVLVILAILAAILVPTLLGYIDRAKSEKDFSTAQTVRVAAQSAIDQAYGEGYKTDNNTKVTAITGMFGLFEGAKGDADLDVTLAANKGKKYSKLVYTLSGVDKDKVEEFKFTYSGGIITGGYVKINKVYYYLNPDTMTWESKGATAPTLTTPTS